MAHDPPGDGQMVGWGENERQGRRNAQKEEEEESYNIHACKINVSLYLQMHARTQWAGFTRGFKWCVMRRGAVITHTNFSKTNILTQEN